MLTIVATLLYMCCSLALVKADPSYFESYYIKSNQDCFRLPSSRNATGESKYAHNNAAGTATDT